MRAALRAPLSAPVRLGLNLGVGVLLLIAAAWLFGAIAEDVVTGDRLTQLDAEIARQLHAGAEPSLTRWILVFTHLHSTVAIACYAFAAALFMYRAREWRLLVTWFVVLGGGMTLNVLMKLAFHRARPTFDDPLLTLTTYSFPSGHVAASTLFYGLIVAFVFSRTKAPLGRGLALLAASGAIGGVAFSRMYLGVHYLSDVAAAFAEGVAWLTLCIGALSTFWRKPALAPDGAAEPAPIASRVAPVRRP